MKIIPAKTPEIAKSLFPNFVWDIPTNDKTLYLTFDDGPTPDVTEWVLNTLKDYNAKGTFFCIGNNIKSYPQIFYSIIKEGHAVGNHTYNHLKGWKSKTKHYIEDVGLTEALISDVLSYFNMGDSTKMFRPPYGKFKSSQSRSLIKKGYKIILWDVLSFDWDARVSPEQCLNNVTEKAKSGSIIVFHDSIKAQKNLKYALPKVLEHFSKKGFNFELIR